MNDKGKLHSEKLLKFVINKFNIKNINGDIFFCRVRANNILNIHDIKEYNKFKNLNYQKKNKIKKKS
jgi:hypothetical protein